MTGPLGSFPDDVATMLDTRVTATARVGGGDINEAFRLTLDDGRSVFVKRNPDGPAGLFAAEAAGLEWLRETATVRVPEVLALRDGDDGFLALEWIERGAPAPDHDERLGRELAALHRFGAETFGLDHDNMIGSIPQRNEPCASWYEFYATRRIEPLARRAIDVGLLPGATAVRFEALFARFDQLCGPPEPPARLHGDLWGGNAIVGPEGHPVLIDPAVYGGHREVDLAMMRLFGGFGSTCLSAYDEAYPLSSGATDRVPLYQLYPLLVHVVLFGGGYASSVMRVLDRYGA